MSFVRQCSNIKQRCESNIAEDGKKLLRKISNDSQKVRRSARKGILISMYTCDDVLEIAKKSGDSGFRLVDKNNPKLDFRNDIRSCLELLSENEELLFFANPYMIRRGTDNTNYVGYSAVTNERVILFTTRWKNYSLSSLSLDNIVSANPVRALLTPRIEIDTVGITDRIILYFYNKGDLNAIADSFMQAVKQAKEMKKSASNYTVQPISAADEIKKFKALLDEGIITQEEFTAKKKQLLGL